MGTFRLLLAFTIVLGHIYGVNEILELDFFHLVGSPIAFQSFFLLTGFTIAMAVDKKYPDKPGSYRLFLSNRVLRIYPLYWFFLILTLVVCLISWKASGRALMLQPIVDLSPDLDISVVIYALVSNVIIIGQELVFFVGIDPESGKFFLSQNFLETNPQAHQLLLISQAWVISFLMIFYLVAPWLLRQSIWLLIGIFFLTQFWRMLYFAEGLHHEPWTYRFLPFEFGLFILGALSYKLYPLVSKISWPKTLLNIFFIAFIIFAAFYDRIIWSPYWHKQWAFYLLLFLAMPFLFQFSAEKKWDRILGDLSLSVYLGHFLVIHLVKEYFILGPVANTVVSFSLVAVLSVIVYFIFQRQIEEVRTRNYEGGKPGLGL